MGSLKKDGGGGRVEEPMPMDFFTSYFVLDDIFGDTVSLEEMGGVAACDFPLNIDVEEQWESERTSSELEKKEDCSELFATIVKANQEVAVSNMNFCLTADDILQDLSGEGILRISRKSRQKHRMFSSLPCEGINDCGEPRLKKIKEEIVEPEPGVEERRGTCLPNSRNPGQEYVFVNDKETNQKRVIALQKGEPLPSRYEMASVQALPQEIMPARQALIIAHSSQGSSTAVLNTRAINSLSSKRIENKQEPPPKKLISLSDLMIAEREKRAKLERFKHREGTGSSSLASIAIVNSTSRGSSGPAVQSINEISPVSNRYVEVEAPHTSSSNIKSPQKAKSFQKPSQSVNPVCALLGCKLCGEVFPCHSDQLFRKHMFVSHGMEIEDKHFEENKVRSQLVLRCNKCRVVVLNKYQEHQKSCSPSVTKEQAFTEMNMSALKWPQKVSHVCGIGECRLVFGMRNELRMHTQQKHSNMAKKMIFDPEFRCAQCLRRFDEAFAMGKHSECCLDMRPRKETIVELAKSLLHCDLCDKNHLSLSETTRCYLNNQVLKCVLCMSLFKDKKLFYTHLHTYHGLKMTEQRLLMDCPMCDKGPDVYKKIFPHIITDHYTPAMNSADNSVPPPIARTSVAFPPLSSQQYRVSDSTVNHNKDSSSASSTTVTNVHVTSSSNSQASRKLPDLQPLSNVSTTITTAPPGIIINTTRLTPGITVSSGLPRSGTTVVKTASQLYTQDKVYILDQPVGKHPVTITPRDQGQPPRVTNILRVVTPASRETSPATSLPMSGLFKPGQHTATRPTPIGLVRPLTTVPSIISRSAPVTMSATPLFQPRGALVPLFVRNPIISNTLTSTVTASVTSRSISTDQLDSSAAQVSLFSAVGQASNATENTSVPKPISNIRSQGLLSAAPNNTTTSAANSPPVLAPLVSSLSTTATPVPLQTPSTTSSAKDSTTATVSSITEPSSAVGAGSSKPSQQDGLTTKANISAKSGSQVINIGGRVYEYKIIQDKLSKKTQPTTQSASGLTVARHSLPNNNYRVPFIPTGLSTRKPIPSTTTASNEQPKSSNLKSSGEYEKQSGK